MHRHVEKLLLLGVCAVFGGCAAPHAPPFATRPYEAFSRTNAIAVALTEWHAWGNRVDDDQGAGYVQTEAAMGERQPGLWQRVGEYWWQGMPPGTKEARWTGTHDAAGRIFPVSANGDYAWSAAFISYVMRVAGAGAGFPYAPDHAHYINYAARAARHEIAHPLLIAKDPAAYAPLPGDLTCFSRGPHLSFADLPTAAPFPAHCAIITSTTPGTDTVIGGNVDDAVTATHLHTDADGRLVSNADDWFVILHVIYAHDPPNGGDLSP